MENFYCPVCLNPFSEEDLFPHIIQSHKNFYDGKNKEQYSCKTCEHENISNTKTYNRKSFHAHIKYKHGFQKTIYDAKNRLKANINESVVEAMEIDRIEDRVPEDWYDNEELVINDDENFKQKLLKLMCIYSVENIDTEKSLSEFNNFSKKLIHLCINEFEKYDCTLETRANMSTVAQNLDIVKSSNPNNYYEITNIPCQYQQMQDNDSNDSSNEPEIKLAHINIKKDMEMFLNHSKIKPYLTFDIPPVIDSNYIRTKFSDGTWYKDHIYNNKKVIVATLFLDDMSINDVRSGHYFNNKITIYSYSICNLADMKSSSVHNIRFMGLNVCDRKDSDIYGKTLPIFLNKFKNLKITLDDEMIDVVVGNIVCDNLANNAINKLPKSFNPNVSGNCRGCILSYSTWQNINLFKNFIPESQLRLHSNNPLLRNICVTFDPFHDANEGFVQNINTLFFYILIKHSNIHYKEIEKELINISKQLSYGQRLADVVRPKMLKNFNVENYPKKFTMNGVEQVQLLKILPVIFFNLEEKNYCSSTLNDENILNVLNLVIETNKILNYLNSKEHSHASDLDYKNSVGKWAEYYIKVCPSKKFTIKEHNLLHYVDMSLKTGIIHVNSTVRFEASNKIMKNAILNSRNKQNVALTGIRNIVRRNLLLAMSQFSFKSNKNIYKIKNDTYILTKSNKYAKIIQKTNDKKIQVREITTEIENNCICVLGEGNEYEINTSEIKDRCHILKGINKSYLLTVMHHCIL